MLRKLQVVFILCFIGLQVKSDDFCTSYKWKSYTTRQDLETNGVLVGDSREGPIYVGGGPIGDRLAPGSITFTRGFLFTYDGSVIPTLKFDYLINEPGNFVWTNSSSLHIKNAVIYGPQGFATGRAMYNGEWQAGKICGPRCIYIASGDKEVKLESYEVLAYQPKSKIIKLNVYRIS